MKDTLITLALIAIAFYICILIGMKIQKNQTIQRALQVKEKPCYEIQDIEIIIFGEIQL